MDLTTGITGAAAQPDEEARPELELADAPPVVPEVAEPEPTFEERSYSLVGRVMRFVMRTISPGAWQSVVQQMAGQLPAKIQLEALGQRTWEKASRHQELVEDLHDQGFIEAGEFFAASMEACVHLLVNEAYDIRAVIYEHANSGVVLDLVTLFGDGTGITYVNREDPGYEQSPLHPNVYLGHVPVFDLLDTCLRDRPKKARLPEPAAAAPRLMELEYEFGAKRLRGESVNPIEIADAYLDVIERSGAAKSNAVAPAVEPAAARAPSTQERKVSEPAGGEPVRWTGRPEAVLPPLQEAIGLTVVEPKEKPSKVVAAGKN